MRKKATLFQPIQPIAGVVALAAMLIAAIPSISTPKPAARTCPWFALVEIGVGPLSTSRKAMVSPDAANTYVFAELLQTPNIQALRNSEDYASHLTLLEIFAWGTWEDYKGKSTLPSLQSTSVHKID